MMFDYPSYADLVGTTLKAMWAPLMPEKKHRDAFNTLIDAKVDYNKSLYEANKTFVEVLQKVSK